MNNSRLNGGVPGGGIPEEVDDNRTEIYLEDLQHLVNDAKNMMQDPSQNKLIIEMNLKLREDLTKAFESYITLLAKCDKLLRDKIQMKFDHAKEKEELHAKMNTIEQRMKTFERALNERERTHIAIVDTYEARINKMKMDINNERTEKFQILKDYSTLKDKYNQEVKAGNEMKF